MDHVLDALAAQHGELAALLDGLEGSGWDRPTPCAGWSVTDVVLHLAQTDELALASLEGEFDARLDVLAAKVDPGSPIADVDAGAGALVAGERGAPGPVVASRWAMGTKLLLDAFRTTEPSARVRWVAGDLAARTLATTRLAETWIHTTDVATALAIEVPPTDRLWHVARLAWRTLPYALARAGRELSGPVAFVLSAPSGETWSFAPEAGAAATTISGPAVDLCRVAGQRLDAARSDLIGTGPDAGDVLALVRTFA